MDLVVTTILKPSPEIITAANEFAATLGLPLVDRAKTSLAAIKAEYDCANVLVMTKAGPVVNTPDGEYFFHLSLAELRIKNLINGNSDHMITAMQLKPGMTVLDCTLGLATDAIVASFAVGPTGRVVGLEASPVIAAITGLGLRSFRGDDADINAALRRITVENADYNDCLTALPADGFDVVYFDPMFRIPVIASSSLKPIRSLADKRPLSSEALLAARRIAKHRVVLKEKNGSPEFARLNFSQFIGGKYSRIRYGVLEAGER